MRVRDQVLFLCAAATLVACSGPLPIDGAACPCGPPSGGFQCNPQTNRCEPVGAAPAPSLPDADAAATPPPMVCQTAGPAPLRRLTVAELRNTVQDLLGVTLTFPFSQENAGPGHFLNAVELQTPTDLLIDELSRAAAQAADLALQRGLKQLLPCDPAGNAEACGRRFVETFGRRAYRRPLEAADQATLMTAFQSGLTASGVEEGVRRVIETVLQSPLFLYRFEVGVTPTMRGAGHVRLTSWEMATRLSYLLWGTMPDHELDAAADAGRLNTPAEVRAQAERMLKDPRSDRMFTTFYTQWWQLDRVLDRAPSGVQTPSGLFEAYRTSAEKLLLLRGRADLPSLLTWPSLPVDASTASFLGLPGHSGKPGFEWLTPAGTHKRFGLLTLPAFLAGHAHQANSNPVTRGQHIYQQLRCESPPVPPPGINIEVPEIKPGLTTRERYAAHMEHPGCFSCHKLFDPIGFGLENFDGLGRWRDTENGRPIDASGHVQGLTFDGPRQLAEGLAQSSDMSRCFVTQWFRFAYGRDHQRDADCQLEGGLHAAFERAGRRVDGLVMAIVESSEFQNIPVGAAR